MIVVNNNVWVLFFWLGKLNKINKNVLNYFCRFIRIG